MGERLADIARSLVGKDYEWGGNGPVTFDCSGLVVYCHKKAGYTYDRTKLSRHEGHERVESPAAGDIAETNGHYVLMIGPRTAVSASNERKGVEICSMDDVHTNWVFQNATYWRYW